MQTALTPKSNSASAYGIFRPVEKDFLLTHEPPAKWMNLHYNGPADDEIYAEISPLGDGPVRVRDRNGVECQLVGYDSRAIYIREEASGGVFCPWGGPAPQPVTERSCRYHAAFTETRGSAFGLRATQRTFVPLDAPVELTTVSLENPGGSPREVSVFSYTLMPLDGRDREGRPFFRDNYSEILPDLAAVMVVNRNRLCPTNRIKGFVAALNHFVAGDGYRDYFLRLEFSLGTPRILYGEGCGNRPGFGPDCAAVLETRFTIPAGGTERVDFVLGQCSGVEEIREIVARYDATTIDRLCEARTTYENSRAECFTVSTGQSDADALLNHFVKKQISAYNINKSGFRDNLQNDVSLAMIDYPEARANLLRALASQFASGKVPHGFRPLIRLTYSDKPAWIFLTVPELIKESGDWSLLEEVVPYLESSESGTVWDHMLRAMRYMAEDTGPHGLSLQHHADWNDGLEATAEAGERESVMVSQQLCYGMLQMIELADRIGESAIATEARQIYDCFKEQINSVAWDGAWYQRTLCGDGYRIGSSSNAEGRIFMNTQSWAIWSRVAEGERALKCMESVDKFLETDIGYRICYPGFSHYDPRVGRMSNSAPGHVENGGCYNHAAGFKGIADCLLGRAEKAWDTFLKVTPGSPWNPLPRSHAAPFSYNNFYSQVPQVYGRSGYPWRTGTANWFTILLVEYILGARRDYDGLRLQPCLSARIPTARVTRKFRGAAYVITIDNSHPSQGHQPKVVLNGHPLHAPLLPIFSEPSTHEVLVTL